MDYDILPSFINYMNNETEEENIIGAINNCGNSSIANIVNSNVESILDEEEGVAAISGQAAATGYNNHCRPPHSNKAAILSLRTTANPSVATAPSNNYTESHHNTSPAVFNGCSLSSSNLPFVQIHTNVVELEPRLSNGYCPVYRQQSTANNRHDEIKFEPIKSENNDANAAHNSAAKEAIPNGRTQRSSPLGATTGALGTIGTLEVEGEVENTLPSNEHILSDNYPEECRETQIFKCDYCPFISLTDVDKEEHLSRMHDKQHNLPLNEAGGNSSKQQQLAKQQQRQEQQRTQYQRIDCPGNC